jgi:hypothetical protein
VLLTSLSGPLIFHCKGCNSFSDTIFVFLFSLIYSFDDLVAALILAVFFRNPNP